MLFRTLSAITLCAAIAGCTVPRTFYADLPPQTGKISNVSSGPIDIAPTATEIDPVTALSGVFETVMIPEIW